MKIRAPFVRSGAAGGGGMILTHGNMQRGETLPGPGVRIGPGFEQRRDRGGVAVSRGKVQRSDAVHGPCVGIGSGFEQRRDHGNMALERSGMHRGVAILVPCAGIGPGPQAGAHIRGAGRREKSRAVPVRAVWLRPRGRKG